MKKIIYISLIILLVFSCSKPEEVTKEMEVTNPSTLQLTPEQYKNTGIITSSLETESMASQNVFFGKTETTPEAFAKVSAPISGILKNTHWIEGMQVRKGQVLANIQDPSIIQLQQDYLLSLSDGKLAKSDLNRQKNLNEDLSASTKNVQQSQNLYQNQIINQAALAQKLRLLGIDPASVSTNNIRTNIAIVAPISGAISMVNVNQGQFVNASDVLYEIQNTNALHLILMVYEKDLKSVFVGQDLKAYINSDPNKTYPAKVHLISKNFDAQRRVAVHCDFSVATPQLYSGMFMNAISEGKAQNSTTLPEDAVVTFEDHTYVFVELPNRQYQMKKVSIGVNENKRIQIINVDPQLFQQKIVVKGAYQLLMALKNIEE